MKAIWNGAVIAESDDTVIVENNHYFPKSALKSELFSPSDTTTFCPLKGHASYFTVTVDGQSNEDAAWSYLEPYEAASQIRDHVAFWKGVEVVA